MTTTPAWDVNRARELNSKLHLNEVVAIALEARQAGAVDAPVWTFDVDLEPWEWARADASLFALFSVTATVQHADGDKRIDLGRVRVALRLRYLVAPSFAVTDEGLVPDYLGTAGWLHAWPYLRAEIQSLTVRVGFPPLVLPVLLAGQTSTVPCRRVGAPSPITVAAPAKKRA